MATNLIPEELQALIDQYLTDGVLTDKERAVILKKAEGMGLDHDEIDLYLDAEVQKIDQATDAAVRKQKGKTCPYCGGSVPQLADKCPHCGENITVQASEELQEIFDNLEEALIDMKSGKDVSRNKATIERYARQAKMYYGGNPKIQKLLAEVEQETRQAEKKAAMVETNDKIKSVMTSRWTWFGLLTLILTILFILSFNSFRTTDGFFMHDGSVNATGAVVFLFTLFPEAIIFIIILFITARWAAKVNNPNKKSLVNSLFSHIYGSRVRSNGKWRVR